MYLSDNHASPTYRPRLRNRVLRHRGQEAHGTHRWLLGWWQFTPKSVNKWFILPAKGFLSALCMSFQLFNLLTFLSQPHPTHTNGFSWIYNSKISIISDGRYATRNRRFPLKDIKKSSWPGFYLHSGNVYPTCFTGDVTETQRRKMPTDVPAFHAATHFPMSTADIGNQLHYCFWLDSLLTTVEATNTNLSELTLKMYLPSWLVLRLKIRTRDLKSVSAVS
jgi:hypothetical protein